MPRIITRIPPQNKIGTPGHSVIVETEGFKGGACLKATEKLKAALGSSGSDGEVEMKEEFYNQEEEKQTELA